MMVPIKPMTWLMIPCRFSRGDHSLPLLYFNEALQAYSLLKLANTVHGKNVSGKNLDFLVLNKRGKFDWTWRYSKIHFHNIKQRPLVVARVGFF